MSLATRCPKCQTLFKVTLGQLQVYEGQVRCGQCQLVFSGIDQLTAADTEAWSDVSLDTANATEASAQGNTEPEFLGVESKKRAWRKPSAFSQAPASVRFSLISLALLLGLQMVWWQRVWVASQVPAVAQWISASEPALQRQFAQPADHTLEIQGSALNRLPGERLELEVTLYNGTRLPSRWPHIRVKLLDPQGLEVATKMLRPEDYKQRNTDATESTSPIAPGNTIEIMAYLNLQSLKERLPGTSATGFEIELFDKSIKLL